MVKGSEEAEILLGKLKQFSSHSIRCPDDLLTLLELSRATPNSEQLNAVCFLAKFVHNTRRIMTRIGKDGEGYDRLATEFSANLEKVRVGLENILAEAPSDLTARFRDKYLAMTQESMQNLMALMSDLSWYKNWLIDNE